MFYVVPLSRNCEKIYKNKTHILLGISPFNSKFSQNYIHQLIDWSSKNFKNVTVLLAGDEAKNLLEALGTPTTKAERKVRKEIRRHFRFSEEVLRKNGREIDIYTFSDFKNNKIYNEVYQNVIYYFLYFLRQFLKNKFVGTKNQVFQNFLRDVRVKIY